MSAASSGRIKQRERPALMCALVALVIALVAWRTPPVLAEAPAVESYALETYWAGEGVAGGALERPIGIAVGSDDTLYVTDGRRRVVRLDPGGGFLETWGGPGDGPGAFANPVGVAVATDGTVYVSDYQQDRIQAFTADGHFLRAFGRHGKGSGEFDSPAGLAVGHRGNVYVADFYNSRVQELTPQGQLVRVIGRSGRIGAGTLHYPTGVAALAGGGILVADAYNHQLQWFTGAGRPERRVGHRLLWIWPRPAGGRDGLDVPTGVAVGADGRIHVADSANHRVVMLDRNGRYLTAWTIPQPNLSAYSPEQVAVSPDGRTVYATDFAGNRVIVLGLRRGR